MDKFKSNFKAKQYEREFSKINVEYKGNSTKRDLLLRKLETSQEYEECVDSINPNKTVRPPGLKIFTITNKELLANGKSQAVNIGYNFSKGLGNLSQLTNYRFYINTPYFDRNGTDPYPLFRLDDPRVNVIVQVVYESMGLIGLKDYDANLLNIIVRIYRPGDILNFHTDRDIFGENIYGVVLENLDKSRGLMLKTKSHSFMLEEEPGVIWSLSDKSRWDYSHGYSTYFSNQNDFVRISVSFRFFENIKQIPKKDFENVVG